MNIIERILKYIEYKEITKTEFSKRCGLANGILKGKNLRDDTIVKIHKSFPDLNIEWLITGKGEMIKKTSSEAEQIKELQEKLRLYEELNNSLKETNHLLKKQLEECERNQKNSINISKTPSELKK